MNNKTILIGRVLAGLIAAFLFFGAFMKFNPTPEMIEGMAKSGMPLEIVSRIGILEILCTVIFLVPQTAVLGAILLTGYLGGAVFAHARLLEAPIAPILVGVLVWVSLWLRDERLRKLIPLRRPS